MPVQLTEDIIITEKKMEKILRDPEASATAIKLVYVSDSQEGIKRLKSGKGFRYLLGNKPVSKTDLERIKKLVIPPAWKDVWICALENGHLQATGKDALQRKQYKYHHLWNKFRNQTKFYRMLQFGKALPQIRKQVEKDLQQKGLPREKVLAAVVALMERTSIRIGNESYEKLYGSFGLTTLKNRHVKINGSTVNFTFKGKKGIEHTVNLTNRKLANIIKQCRELPGKELFLYEGEDGTRQSVDSGMVNEYIKNIVESDFTAKDFRTWSGTVQALVALKELTTEEKAGDYKKNIVEALDKVSKQLGNTRTVCRKYYVHPTLLELYEKDGLAKYLDKLDLNTPDTSNNTGLAREEKVFMQILEDLK